MNKIKRFLRSHPKLMRTVFALYNALPFNNKVKGRRGNKIEAKGMMKKCKIRFRGKNNTVEIGEGVTLRNCTINVLGNNSRIVFGDRSYAHSADLCTEDNGSKIIIGRGTGLCGKLHMAAIEGTGIIIGEDCLFSSETVFRTGDSHSILNMQDERINFSKDIVIEDHVWIGHRVCVTKGVRIAKNNIVGTGAVVTKSIEQSNAVIAGVPARVVKTDVNWDAERK